MVLCLVVAAPCFQDPFHLPFTGILNQIIVQIKTKPWYSKASKYTASSCTDLDNEHFWSESKKNWDARFLINSYLKCMDFWEAWVFWGEIHDTKYCHHKMENISDDPTNHPKYDNAIRWHKWAPKIRIQVLTNQECHWYIIKSVCNI